MQRKEENFSLHVSAVKTMTVESENVTTTTTTTAVVASDDNDDVDDMTTDHGLRDAVVDVTGLVS